MRRLVLGLVIVSIVALTPVGAFADDRQIGQHIQEKLIEQRDQGKLKGFDVRMRIDQGTVWLTGHVASEDQRKLVLNIASHTAHLGTVQVVNDIKINESKVAAKPATASKTSAKNLLASMGINVKNPFSKSDSAQAPAKKPSPKAVARTSSRRSATRTQPAQGTGVAKPTADASLATSLQELLRGSKAAPKPALTVEVKPQTVAVATPAATTEAPAAVTQAIVQTPAQPVAAAAIPIQPQPRPAMQPAPAPAAVAPQMAVPRMAVPMHLVPVYAAPNQMPIAYAPAQGISHAQPGLQPVPINQSNPVPAYQPGYGHGVAPAHHDHPSMPGYAWPAYASHPNYAAATYPKQYSPQAWPYIGPFYPYPQVPLGWRKVTLEWDDGWWFLDFKSR